MSASTSARASARTSARTGAPQGRALLVSAPYGAFEAHHSLVSRVAVLRSVGRRLVPRLIEATLIPTVLFYVFLMTIGSGAAIGAALSWSYGVIAYRLVTGRPISGLLVLGAIGLGVRSVFVFFSGSTFMYFVQPIGTTLALAAVFLCTVFVGKPLIARLATDFCPMAPDVAARPQVTRLLRALTVLWACVHLFSAAVTLSMLLSVRISTYVVLKTAASLVITTAAVVWTVLWSVRVAHRENLVFAAIPA